MMTPTLDHERWMALAIKQAHQAGLAGEVPVGAVIVHRTGKLMAVAENLKERHQDPTAHAEIVAIRQACQGLNDWHLNECTLYVTLEPCPMCAGAIVQARMHTLVYGTDDPKTGAVHSVLNLPDSPASFHKLQVISGVRQVECQQQLQAWFRALRQKKQAE